MAHHTPRMFCSASERFQAQFAAPLSQLTVHEVEVAAPLSVKSLTNQAVTQVELVPSAPESESQSALTPAHSSKAGVAALAVRPLA